MKTLEEMLAALDEIDNYIYTQARHDSSREIDEVKEILRAAHALVDELEST